jgi:hypothetical protein
MMIGNDARDSPFGGRDMNKAERIGRSSLFLYESSQFFTRVDSMGGPAARRTYGADADAAAIQAKTAAIEGLVGPGELNELGYYLLN